ncbi:MAG: sigma-70 family RNA polymerase sigma factor [Puniceicoccaceae bacterium]|nr:MAG: sigma-70 family RNA polymerase sigma factor [Puniceicoccaceae bacterium]
MEPSTPYPSWEACLQDHGPCFLLFARQQTPSEADARDVYQEAFLRVWKAGVPPVPGLFYRALRHAAIDLGRRQSRRRRREEFAGQPAGDGIAGWFAPDPAHSAEQAAITAELRQLPPEQQEVVVLHLWGGLTFAEIAATLDLSPHTAASRYRYGLENLRRRLT